MTLEQLLAEMDKGEQLTKELAQEAATKQGTTMAGGHFLPDLNNIPSDDFIGLYFLDVAEESLLSATEEVELSQAIEAGQAATKSVY